MQLNFFITPLDWPKVLDFLVKHNIQLIEEPDAKPEKIDLKPVTTRAEQHPKTMYITDRAFSDHIFFDYSEKRDEYSIDIFKSYLLEFSPGGFFPIKPNELERGRFYCVTSYYVTNGEKVAKNEDFVKWVQKLFRLFKREFLVKMGDERMIWFSKNTLEWIDEKKGVINTAYTSILF
jgi:hypothetical protein